MRKEIDVTIQDDNRDKGKTFHIVEMPAWQVERWAMRCVLALGRAGVDMPDDVAAGGIAGLASAGLRALLKLNYDDAAPLLDEMLACVSIKCDPARPDITRNLFPDDIEEVSTFAQLRMEVFTLHTGFSMPGKKQS